MEFPRSWSLSSHGSLVQPSIFYHEAELRRGSSKTINKQIVDAPEKKEHFRCWFVFLVVFSSSSRSETKRRTTKTMCVRSNCWVDFWFMALIVVRTQQSSLSLRCFPRKIIKNRIQFGKKNFEFVDKLIGESTSMFFSFSTFHVSTLDTDRVFYIKATVNH